MKPPHSTGWIQRREALGRRLVLITADSACGFKMGTLPALAAPHSWTATRALYTRAAGRRRLWRRLAERVSRTLWASPPAFRDALLTRESADSPTGVAARSCLASPAFTASVWMQWSSSGCLASWLPSRSGGRRCRNAKQSCLRLENFLERLSRLLDSIRVGGRNAPTVSRSRRFVSDSEAKAL